MNFFGSKYRIAKLYPPPEHDTIVEPFAGSAGYAMRWHERRVVLVEKSPEIAGVWRYLIHPKTTERSILRIPLLGPDDTVDGLKGLSEEQRWLIGMNINAGSDRPRNNMSRFAVEYRPPWPTKKCKGTTGPHEGFENFWGEKRRARIARQVESIKHWHVIEGSYEQVGNVRATWFVDAPYVCAGRSYKHSKIDRKALAAWCRSRWGQVMVCEGEGASWLPFEPFGVFKSTPGKKRPNVVREFVWMGGTA